MRKTREILRQKWCLGRSHREVARSLGKSLGAIRLTLRRATAAGLDWGAALALSDEALDGRLYRAPAGADPGRFLPDFAAVHAEHKRPGVTLELLHLEYLEQHSDGYLYTQFCEYYRRGLTRRRLSMRQIHRAGEKLFVDYAGQRPQIVDPGTGEVTAVELFVAVLGASSLTYAEATATQRVPDFLASHVRTFEFLGGVTAAVVPDQLKSAVTVPCRYEPGVQRAYEELAQHYGTAILPARPGKPRDKAKVEVAVQVAERWILARLRDETFFSLAALNGRIRVLLIDLNARTMRAYGASGQELFERLDRPALKPLPAERFVHAEWKAARVNLDYHVELDRHYCSVPHALVHEQVELRFTGATVEVLLRGQRVATHARSHERGRHTTIAAHMPKAHQKHLAWTPSRLVHWARSIGQNTQKWVEAILADRPHPEQGYRSCLGILRLSKRYGPERLEAACTRAVAVRARSYRHVDSILKRGLDRVALPAHGAQAATQASVSHENVRGADYYQSTPHEGADHAERTDDGEAARTAPQRPGGGLDGAAAKSGQQQPLL
jgi:transposase